MKSLATVAVGLTLTGMAGCTSGPVYDAEGVATSTYYAWYWDDDHDHRHHIDHPDHPARPDHPLHPERPGVRPKPPATTLPATRPRMRTHHVGGGGHFHR